MTNPQITWQVSGLTPTVKFVSGSNVPTEGFDVHFTMNSGVGGSVFVPTAQIGDVERVRAAVIQRATELNTIHNLSG